MSHGGRELHGGWSQRQNQRGRRPRRPRGAGEERPADAPPSALRETEEGPVSRPAAPGSLFSVCSLPDSETIGVPHPEPGRGRRHGGSGDSVLLACLSSSEHGPGGPGCRGRGQGQAGVPCSPPLVLGSSHLARPDLLQTPRYHRVGKQQSWGGVTGPQLPAYLLWEPSTQPSLADDLLCASSGHPAMGKAGPGALQPLF